MSWWIQIGRWKVSHRQSHSPRSYHRPKERRPHRNISRPMNKCKCTLRLSHRWCVMIRLHRFPSLEFREFRINGTRPDNDLLQLPVTCTHQQNHPWSSSNRSRSSARLITLHNTTSNNNSTHPTTNPPKHQNITVTTC